MQQRFVLRRCSGEVTVLGHHLHQNNRRVRAHVGFMVDLSDIGVGFLRIFQFPLLFLIPPTA
jgi:ABC-type multidrug transport system ATPase subunit